MIIYAVIIDDYDLYNEYGFYKSKERAEQRKKELEKDINFTWKKYLKIEEKELIE